MQGMQDDSVIVVSLLFYFLFYQKNSVMHFVKHHVLNQYYKVLSIEL